MSKSVWEQIQKEFEKTPTKLIVLVIIVGVALIAAGLYVRTMVPGALVPINQVTVKVQPTYGEFPDDLIITIKIYDENLVEIANDTLEGPFWTKVIKFGSSVTSFYVAMTAPGYYKDFYNLTKIDDKYLDYIEVTEQELTLTYNLTKIATININLNNSTDTGYAFIKGELNISEYSMLKNVTFEVTANNTDVTFYNVYINGTAYALDEPFDLINEENETQSWGLLIDYRYDGTTPVEVTINVTALNEDLDVVTVAAATVYILI